MGSIRYRYAPDRVCECELLAAIISCCRTVKKFLQHEVRTEHMRVAASVAVSPELALCVLETLLATCIPRPLHGDEENSSEFVVDLGPPVLMANISPISCADLNGTCSVGVALAYFIFDALTTTPAKSTVELFICPDVQLPLQAIDRSAHDSHVVVNIFPTRHGADTSYDAPRAIHIILPTAGGDGRAFPP